MDSHFSLSERPDILQIQEQIKEAIHNHQLIVSELNTVGENEEFRKKLDEIQKYIAYLGKSQGRLLKEIREKVSVNGNYEKIEDKHENENGHEDITEVQKTYTNNNKYSQNSLDLNLNERCTRKRTYASVDSSPVISRSNSPVNRRNSIDKSSARSSPVEQRPARHSLLTRSSRSLICVEDREPSPTLDNCPEPVDVSSGNIDAALNPKGTIEEQKQCYLECLGLVTHEKAVEINKLLTERRTKPSAMDPFLFLQTTESSSKKRKETDLPCNNSENSTEDEEEDDIEINNVQSSVSVSVVDSQADVDKIIISGDVNEFLLDPSDHEHMFNEHHIDNLFTHTDILHTGGFFNDRESNIFDLLGVEDD